MSDERADQLDLSLMVVENTESMKDGLSRCRVDLIGGTTAGISAADRSATVKLSPIFEQCSGTNSLDLATVFPAYAQEKEGFKRAGHTECSCGYSVQWRTDHQLQC